MCRPSRLALLAAASLFAPLSAYAQNAAPRAELELSGDGQAALSTGIFVPFALADGTVVFADGWLSYQDGGPLYGSVGGGVRQPFGDWVLGAYGHFDFANSSRDFSYQQISAGIEALSQSWEFRINGFAPVGENAHQVDGLSTVQIRNGQFVANQGYEVALYGVDAEAGIRLPVFDADSPSSLKLFAGAFASDSAFTDAVAGLKLRTELTLALDQYLPGATLGFGAGLSLDSTSQMSASAHIRLSAPIGGAPTASSASSPVYQRVERDRAIAITAGAFGPDEAAFGGSGSAQVIQISAGTGNSAAINRQIAQAGEGAIILASGEIALDSALVLATRQIMVGGGGVIDLVSASGKHLQYRNTGAATVLNGNAPSSFALVAPVVVDGIHLADGSIVSTLSIIGTENAIVASGVNNVTIDNVTIDGVSGNGIALNDVTGATITRSRIGNVRICELSSCEFSIFNPSYVPNAAINAVGIRDLTIDGLDIANTTYGIFVAPVIDSSGWPSVVTSAAEGIDIRNVSITSSRREALMTVGASNIAIDNLRVDNSALGRDMDLVVFQTSKDITLSNSTLRGGVNALMFAYYSGIPGENPNNIQVSNVDIFDTSRAGVFINPSHDIRFTDVTVTNAGTYGVFFYGDAWGFMGGPVRDIAFDGFVINSALDGAAYISGPLKNIDGDLAYGGATLCMADTGPWSGTTITQDAGLAFTLNGVEVTHTTLSTLCH